MTNDQSSSSLVEGNGEKRDKGIETTYEATFPFSPSPSSPAPQAVFSNFICFVDVGGVPLASPLKRGTLSRFSPLKKGGWGDLQV